MTMDTNGPAGLACLTTARLLALRECESLLAMEGPQRFGLDDIVSGGRYFNFRADAVAVRDCKGGLLTHENRL
jgi:hypothetical protein